MKKPKVNLNWPVEIFDIQSASQDPNEKFSRGKLKVFYQGETADHRYFSESFSEKLLQSIPYTPIVSRYNSETKDFEGHASEQSIYGIVDPCRQPSFEKDESGVNWAICDVVLYTERPDQTGEIAKQIIGHSQSLEMTDAKYTVNYDAKRHFKNIEFTDGKFIGISVLGTDQAPAFTGSQFFSCGKENFEEKMQILREYCENEGQKEKVSNGGQMRILNHNDFMKLSWGEISATVSETIFKEYAEEAYTEVVDMDENFAYVVFYSYIDGSCCNLRIAYSINEDGSVLLGEVAKVHRTWEVLESSSCENNDNSAENYSEETEPAAEIQSEVAAAVEQEGTENVLEQCEVIEENTEVTPATEETKEEVETTETFDQLSNDNADSIATEEASNEETPAPDALDTNSDVQDQVEFTEGSQIQSATQESEVSDSELSNEPEIQEKDSSSTSLTESEREQFEALKKGAELQVKIDLLESYKDQLSEESFKNFSDNLVDFTKDDLEVSILKSIVEYQKESRSSVKRVAAYTMLNNAIKKDDNDDAWVRKALHR